MQHYEISFPVAQNNDNHLQGKFLWHRGSILPKLCFLNVWDTSALTCPSKQGIALRFREPVLCWQGSVAPSLHKSECHCFPFYVFHLNCDRCLEL